VCSKNVTNYEHFGPDAQKRCPLHDNVEDRHEQEVKKAADEAMAKVRADNPDLSDADLMIKVSDRVKQAEDARKGQAVARANAFPYHMVENQLRHRVPPLAVPIIQLPDQIDPPVAQYVPLNPYAVVPAPLLVQPMLQLPPQPYNAAGPALQQPQQYVCVQHIHPFRSFTYPFNCFYRGNPPDFHR
jgi:TRIAD3 protein (E3 ubiquitin-protein ligase RNF216)